MISNMIGPVEKMALVNLPVKGLYFTVPGMPQVYDHNLIFSGEKKSV